MPGAWSAPRLASHVTSSKNVCFVFVILFVSSPLLIRQILRTNISRKLSSADIQPTCSLCAHQQAWPSNHVYSRPLNMRNDKRFANTILPRSSYDETIYNT